MYLYFLKIIKQKRGSTGAEDTIQQQTLACLVFFIQSLEGAEGRLLQATLFFFAPWKDLF